MKQWIKNYLVYLLLAVSVLFNVNLFTKNQRMDEQINSLQAQMDASAVDISIYDGQEELIKSLSFLPNQSGISLYALLNTLNERQLLSSVITSSGWITELHDIEGIGTNNQYWVIFSSTNIACAGFSDAGYDYPNVCNFGSKDIMIGFNDSFEFRLLAWNA